MMLFLQFTQITTQAIKRIFEVSIDEMVYQPLLFDEKLLRRADMLCV